MPSYLPELTRLLRIGSLVAVLGDHFATRSGLPPAGQVAGELRKRILDERGITLPQEFPLEVDAQLFDNEYGRNELVRAFRTAWDAREVRPGPELMLFAQLPAGIIIQTSLDDLREQAYVAIGCPVNRLVAGRQLPYWDESKVNLFYLYGSLQTNPDQAVLTRRERLGFFRRQQAVVRMISDLLITRSLLFLGQDAGIQELLRHLDEKPDNPVIILESAGMGETALACAIAYQWQTTSGGKLLYTDS